MKKLLYVVPFLLLMLTSNGLGSETNNKTGNGFLQAFKAIGGDSYMSLSIRDGFHEAEELEYEIKVGLVGKYGVLDLKWEQEYDKFYKGVYLKSLETSFGRNKWYSMFNDIFLIIHYNETNNMDYITITKNMVDFLDIFKVQMVNKWNSYIYKGVLLGVEINFDVFDNGMQTNIQYTTDLYTEHTCSMKIHKRFLFDSRYGNRYEDIMKVYLEPKFKFYQTEGNRYWQTKVEVGVQF